MTALAGLGGSWFGANTIPKWLLVPWRLAAAAWWPAVAAAVWLHML